MRKKILSIFVFLSSLFGTAQVIDTDKVMIIGRNALHYEDYVLSIQYFNEVIRAKPHLPEPYYYRAIAKLCLEDFKGASEDFSICLNKNPFIEKAYALRADARLNCDSIEGAISDYQRVLALDPKNQVALINEGLAYIRKKDFTMAQTRLDTLLSFYPSFSQGFLVRGGMYIEKGDTISAMKDYEAAIKQDPNYMQAHANMGLLLIQKKKYEEAIKYLDEAIRLDPLVMSNYMNRALARYYKDDYRGAMNDFDKVVDLEPNNVQGRFNRALLRAQVGDNNNAIADLDVVLDSENQNYIAYYNRALLRFETGNYKGTIADLDKVLINHPEFYQGFYFRGEVKRRMGEVKASENDFKMARAEEARVRREVFAGRQPSKKTDEKTREKSDDTMDKFNLLMTADQSEQDKSRYTNSARGRVQDKQATINLEPMFVLSYYEEEGGKAVHFYQEVEKLNHENQLASKIKLLNHEASMTEEQIKTHFSSIENLTKQIAANREKVNLYLLRAIDYLLVQNIDNALSDLKKAIALNDKQALTHFMLGVAYSKQMELMQASKLEKATEPELKVTKETIGLPKQITENSLDGNNAEYNLALRSFDKAIQLEENFTYAYYNRGNLKAQTKNYKDAIMDYNEAIRLDKGFAEAYFNRGICRLFIGDKDRGLSDLRSAGELGIVNAYSIVKRMSR